MSELIKASASAASLLGILARVKEKVSVLKQCTPGELYSHLLSLQRLADTAFDEAKSVVGHLNAEASLKLQPDPIKPVNCQWCHSSARKGTTVGGARKVSCICCGMQGPQWADCDGGEDRAIRDWNQIQDWIESQKSKRL